MNVFTALSEKLFLYLAPVSCFMTTMLPSEILVHIYIIASHSCYTSVKLLHCSTTYQRCSAIEVIWVQWTTDWNDLTLVTCCIFLLEVFNRIWVPCDRKVMDIVSNNSQVGCGIQTMLRCFKGCQSVPRKHLHHSTNSNNLYHWWIHGFMFTPSSGNIA